MVSTPPEHDISGEPDDFWTVKNHGSNVGVIDDQTFVVWFHGGEREGKYVEIYATNTDAASPNWPTEDPIVWAPNLIVGDNGADGTVPYFPAVNPCFVFDKDRSLLQLFWIKVSGQRWGEVEIHTRTGYFLPSYNSVSQIKWNEPVDGRVVDPSFDEDTFLDNTKRYLANCWPLSDGDFNPVTSYLNSPSFGGCSGESGPAADVDADQMQNLFDALIDQIDMFDNSFFENVKADVSAQSADYQSILQNVTDFQGLGPAASAHLGQDSLKGLLNFLYSVWDTYVVVSMQLTVFNENAPKFYKKGWETRTLPIYVCLPDGGKRLLLGVYSDISNVSLVLYSDDGGDNWAYANTPIAARAGIQPTMVQLPGGKVVAFLRNNGGFVNLNATLFSESCDYGLTWSPAVPLLPDSLQNRDSSIGSVLMNTGKFAGNPKVVLVHDQGTGKNALYLSVGNLDKTGNAISSWEDPITLQPGTGLPNEEFDYPSIGQGENGEVFASFSHEYTEGPDNQQIFRIGVVRYDGFVG